MNGDHPTCPWFEVRITWGPCRGLIGVGEQVLTEAGECDAPDAQADTAQEPATGDFLMVFEEMLILRIHRHLLTNTSSRLRITFATITIAAFSALPVGEA